MVRTILAIIGGYAAIAVATMVVVGILAKAFGLPMDPGAITKKPPTAYILANLAASAACALLGGFVAARIGIKAPQQHAMILAAILLVIGAIYAFVGRSGPQPMWYLLALPIVGAAGAVLGGMLVHPQPGLKAQFDPQMGAKRKLLFRGIGVGVSALLLHELHVRLLGYRAAE